jgi:hypothetical protein
LRKWGGLITLFYALVLLGFLIPAGALLLAEEHWDWWGILVISFVALLVIYKEWMSKWSRGHVL